MAGAGRDDRHLINLNETRVQHLEQANWPLNRHVRDACRTTTTLKASQTVAGASPLFGDHL
jgi:hypothetical protein